MTRSTLGRDGCSRGETVVNKRNKTTPKGQTGHLVKKDHTMEAE